jgi:hypothetical protein
MFFEQNATTVHIANNRMTALRNIIGKEYPINSPLWPARSLYLQVLSLLAVDMFIAVPPISRQELQSFNNTFTRCQECMRVKGGNLQRCYNMRYITRTWPIPVAAWPKVRVCGRSLAVIASSNPAVGMDVCRECRVFSSRGLCDGPITHPEESYRV